MFDFAPKVELPEPAFPMWSSTVTPRIEVSTDHGVFIFNWPCVPRVGDYIRVVDDLGDDHAEQVQYVVWSENGITVDADCALLPGSDADGAA